MEILSHKNHRKLLEYLPHIKLSLQEWLLVDIRLTESCDKDFTVDKAAERVHAHFGDKEGKLYICNDHEILMLVWWGKDAPAAAVVDTIGKSMPEGSCVVHAHETTMDGITKLEMLITYKKTVPAPTFLDIRNTRRENIILVADDDMYMRALVKKGLATIGTVIEVATGDEVENAYRQHNPDVLFLDIHMPGRSGRDVVYQLSELDPNSYIIMISADGSHENVTDTWQKGAKEFLTKPFTKGRLLECVRKCPTIS